MKQKNKIPTFIALFLLIAGIVAGIFLVKNSQIFRLGASPNSAPQDVRISNISDISFTVSWTTDKATTGVVKWGKSADSLDQPVNDELPNPGFVHSTTVKPLSPQTAYYFEIYTGSQENNNNGVPWQVTTGPVLGQPAESDIVSGTVITSTGEPVKNSLVYITVGGGSLISTTTSQNGSWLVPISSSRGKDLTSLTTIDDTQTLIEISVNAGPDGISTAQIYPESAKPMPPMVLGQVHDFKNLSPSAVGDVPSASVDLPSTSSATVSSGFNISNQAPVVKTKSVTLDSVKDGETVNTTTPEFFGKGPSGTTVTITVESDNPITDEVTIPTNESWKWSPPAGLDPGNHTITITWRDAQGILRTLTKNFVVSASDGPAFVSTPSATLEPEATDTPIPEETETPTAIATPVSGDLTPTVLLFMMSIGVISFAIVLWKKSESLT